MSRIRRWVSTLQPAYLFALPVMLGAAAEFVLGQLTSPYSLRAPILLNLGSYVIAIAGTFLVLGAVYGLLYRSFANDVLRGVLLISIPVAAALGGGLMGWVRYVTGLDADSLLALRMLSTVAHVTTATILLWLAVSGVRLHYARLDALLTERDRLEVLRMQATQDLSALSERATEAVRSRILQDLVSLERFDARSLLSTLTNTIEDTIRPLSRQLESQSPPWIPPLPEARGSERINWRAAAIEGASPALLNPLGVLGILSLISLPMNLFRVGPAFAIQYALLTTLIAVPLYFGIRRAFIRIAGQARAVVRIMAFLGMCLLCGLAWGASTLVITWGTPQPFRFLWLCPVFTIFFAYMWGFAAAAQMQARSTESDLRTATDKLRWRIARKRELHRQQQRALAHAVHGEVQAALAAGILQLEMALQEGTATDQQVDEVRTRIIACVRELDLRNVRPSPLPVVVAKVQATWAGAVTLSMSVDPNLEDALHDDPQCLLTINDLVPELVFNSIKHGKAKDVRITLVRGDERTLTLSCQDDGVVFSEDATGGLGSRLLDDCAIQWSRERHGSSTVLMAVLPIAATQATWLGGSAAPSVDSPSLSGTAA